MCRQGKELVGCASTNMILLRLLDLDSYACLTSNKALQKERDTADKIARLNKLYV